MVRYHLACLALLIAVSGIAPAAVWELTPLQEATCEMPPPLRTVTGHALFRYSVGPAGTVDSIDELYVAARPASREDAFVAALRTCLQGWRYKAPAEQRLPISTQMLMAFHYFEPAPEGAPSLTAPGGRSIPRCHVEEMRKEKIRLASRLLAGGEYTELRGDGYLVRTNVAEGPRNMLREAIDRAQRVFGEVFPSAPPLPTSSMLNVFLFRDEDSFNQVAAFDNLIRMRGGIAGQYSPVEQTAYASLGMKPARIVIGEMVHEVTHHLVHQRLFQDGRDPPYWVNEGIATFVEMLPAGKTLDIDRFERGRQKQDHYRWRSQGDIYLDALSREAKEGTEPDLEAFLSGAPRVGRMKSDVAYGLSWLIVHYLVTGEHQAHREKFQNWLLTRADRRRGDSVLADIGLTLEEFRQRLAGHRKRIRAAAYR